MNEADNVMPLVKRIYKAVGKRKVEVLFVDDSHDMDTVEQVALARMAYRSAKFDVHVFHRVDEQRWGGLSGAVADGMRSAHSDQVIIMDGDLQHPPELLPKLMRAGKKHGIVIASRYCKGGNANGLDGGFRHLVSRACTLLAKVCFPWRLRTISDPMTGYFLVHRQLIDRNRLRPKGFKILLEILASHPELSKTEIPLQFAARQAGHSHGDLKQGIAFLEQLMSLRFGQVAHFFVSLPKFVQFGIIGGSVFGFGMVLLYALVELAGWPPLLANAVQLAVTFGLNYILNRHITWRERHISRLAVHKFLLSRTATTVVNYLLFAWLISLHYAVTIEGRSYHFTIHYIVANIITLIAVMALNYEISDRWAFATPKQRLSRRERRIAAGQTKQSAVGLMLLLAFTIALASSIFLAPHVVLPIVLVTASLLLFMQSSFETWRMAYSYRNPDSVDKLHFPRREAGQEKFCIIVPARHESNVLAATLDQLAQQTYQYVDIITVICDDDIDTLLVADAVAARQSRVKVMRYPLGVGVKPNKPLQLNYVLAETKGSDYTIVGIVDAEDSVHPELLSHVAAAFSDPETSLVQGGVQLMDHHSSWYSLHNVLEYYRWFNSAMAFQADSRFMPLGGNTIFIRDQLLRKAGGWPTTLTEDCSLGVLLSSRFKARTAVYYEPWLATREETPDTLRSLFKQRVRWNQGFLQEWRKGVWQELPTLKQRILAVYVLLNPLLLALISLFMMLSIGAAIWVKQPVGLVLLMYLPFIPVCLLVGLNALYLHDFGKAFNRSIRTKDYLLLLATQQFYLVVLNTAALWSVIRELRGETSWQKTSHAGKHRDADLLPIYTAPANAASMENGQL